MKSWIKRARRRRLERLESTPPPDVVMIAAGVVWLAPWIFIIIGIHFSSLISQHVRRLEHTDRYVEVWFLWLIAGPPLLAFTYRLRHRNDPKPRRHKRHDEVTFGSRGYYPGYGGAGSIGGGGGFSAGGGGGGFSAGGGSFGGGGATGSW